MELAVELTTVTPAETASTDVARLTRLMRQGNEEAYREFFRLYFHRLLAYLLSITSGNEALAHDLVQHTMLKVARHVRVFEDEAIFWRWLTVLAHTAAVDEGRKSQRYFAFLERWWRARSNDPAPDHVDRVSQMLSAGLEHLEPEERLLLESKYLDQTSVRDIAAELGLGEKAVESRLTRARLKLKALLLKGLNS